MTIQEAINSNKYFYRQKYGDEYVFCIRENRLCTTFLYYSEPTPTYCYSYPEYSGFEQLNTEDILADDWEVVSE